MSVGHSRTAYRRLVPKVDDPAIYGGRLDLWPIRVPVSAGTLVGFNKWFFSSKRPPHTRLHFSDGSVSIELPDLKTIEIPATAFTCAGFTAWAISPDFPQRGHIFFLGEEIFIDMSPEELETHNSPKTTVVGEVYALNKELDRGKLYSDRALLSNAAVGLSTEPDGMLILWESLMSKRARLIPRTGPAGQYMMVQGSPDWILEIVSKTTVWKDTTDLRKKYHRAKIGEYWLIDARGEEIDFKIFQWRRQGFVAVRARDGWLRSRVFGRSFRLERQPDRMGFWQYTLLVKAD